VVFCAVAACVWTLPWAAWSVVQFDPYLAPSLFSSGMVLLRVALFVIDWGLGPMLLIAGVNPARDRGAWWYTAWLAAIAAGAAFGVAAVVSGGLFVDDLYDPAHPRWPVLAWGAGFLLLAVVLAVLLAGSPRALLSAARTVAASAAREARARGRRTAAICGALAIAVAALTFSLARSPGPVTRVLENYTAVAAVALSPDGRDMVMAGEGDDVSVRAVPSGSPVMTVPASAVSYGFVNSLALSPGGTILALGMGSDNDEGGGTQAWSTATGRPAFSVPDPNRGASVLAVAVSPDGTVVASGDDAGSVFLFDAANGRLLARLKTGQDGVESLAFSPDGRELATAAFGGTIRVWRIATGTVTASTAVLAGWVRRSAWDDDGAQPVTVAFRPGGGTLAIGDARSGVYLWTVGTSRLAWPVRWSCGSEFTCENAAPGSVSFSQDGTYAAGAVNDRAEVWSLPSGTLTAKVADPVGYGVSAVAVSDDGKTLAIGDDDGGPDTDVTFFPAAYVYKIP